MATDTWCFARVESGDLDLEQYQCTFFRGRRILSMIYFVINVIVYVPIMLYGIQQIYKFRNTVIMQKRHYGLSIAIAICTLLQVLFISAMLLFLGSYAKWEPFGPLFFIMANIIGFCLIYIIFIKTWIHYYDIKCNATSCSKAWKSVINPDSVDTAHNNWFLKHRQTFGNPKYLLKWIMIGGIITGIFIVVLDVILVNKTNKKTNSRDLITVINGAIIIIICMFPIIMTLYIGCRIPSFHDPFHIETEAKYVEIVTFASISLSVIQLILLYVYGPILRIIAVLTFWLLFTTLAFIFTLIVTIWALKKNENALYHIDRQSVAQSPYRMHLELTKVESMQKSSSISANSTSLSKSKLKLQDIVQDKYGFQLLTTHLGHEFSMELILSLIEMLQFKRCIHEYVHQNEEIKDLIDENEEQNEWDILNDICFGCMVPPSIIVYGNLEDEYLRMLTECANNGKCKKIAEYKIRAYKLYKRYIRIGCEYEINIGYGTRGTLIRLMNDIQNWLDNELDVENGNDNDQVKEKKERLLFLFNLFDGAIDETRGLLKFSFSRLKTSAAFEQYVANNAP